MVGKTTITFNDVTWDVEFDYEKYIPQTKEYPAEGGFEQVFSICLNKTEFIDILSEQAINEIEYLTQQKFENNGE
jgi:hypothetical protein